jgi:hypothetical protein
MSRLGWFWDWLLPGLICLCPMAAIAYYNAGAENEVPNDESPRVERRVPDALRGSVVIHLARL